MCTVSKDTLRIESFCAVAACVPMHGSARARKPTTHREKEHGIQGLYIWVFTRDCVFNTSGRGCYLIYRPVQRLDFLYNPHFLKRIFVTHNVTLCKVPGDRCLSEYKCFACVQYKEGVEESHLRS